MDGVSAAPHCRLALLLALAVFIHFSSGISQVSRKVKEMATLSCDYNLSVDELSRVRIYWQKDSHVVLSFISGTVEVWPTYKNRTLVDIVNNVSLVILALRLSDKGTYTCVIQKLERGSYKREHLISVILSIRADFPSPTITECVGPSPNIKRIRCSTSGGFPKPRLSWIENGEELNAFNTTVSQDPTTELYSISSELDFNMMSNHSFVCSVKYGDLTVSENFHWPTPIQETSHNHLLYLLIISPVVFAILIMFYCLHGDSACAGLNKPTKKKPLKTDTFRVKKSPKQYLLSDPDFQDLTPATTQEMPPVISAVVHAADEEKLVVTNQKWIYSGSGGR